MIDLERPESERLRFLSPTSFELGQPCPLRLAFRQQPSAVGVERRTPALRLGDAAHRVLDCLVKEHRMATRREWDRALEILWDAEIKREAEFAEAAGELSIFGPPGQWHGYQLKRVRLGRMGGRLYVFLSSLSPSAQVLPEHELDAFGGRIRGRLDLLIEEDGEWRLLDYKTGTAVDRQTLDVRRSYSRQLQLYAVLVAENLGGWPVSAELIPLEGPPVQVDLDEALCRALAAEVVELLEDFNASVPHAPALPGATTCSVCRFATRCAVCWAQMDSTWGEQVLAAGGIATKVVCTPVGGTSIDVKVTRGSVDEQAILIRNIDPMVHAAASRAVEGSDIIAVGLLREPGKSSFRLSPYGGLRVG